MRTVLVTGGNKGIGRACVERFAAAGHRVLATGRDTDALAALTVEIPGVEAVPMDVTDVAAWEAFEDSVDVLVANAGVAHTNPVQRTALEDWEHMFQVNVTGVFLGAKALLPGMRQRGWGRIIAVASVAGHRGVRYGSAYSASKHAVVGLIRSVAAEVAGTPVTANSVCPGFVESAMTDRSVARIVEATDQSADQARRALEGMQPLGRLVQPSEVAAAVAYLASDEAGAVNGQSIIIDGGGVQQ